MLQDLNSFLAKEAFRKAGESGCESLQKGKHHKAPLVTQCLPHLAYSSGKEHDPFNQQLGRRGSYHTSLISVITHLEQVQFICCFLEKETTSSLNPADPCMVNTREHEIDIVILQPT